MKASLALAIFISAVLVGAVWIVYLNRASEKIVSAALPIAAAAVLALCLSVFVFGADPPQAARFEVSYTINMDDKKPSPEVVICKQNGEFSLQAMDEVSTLHPEFLKNPRDTNAIQLYNHLLQWEIMRRISIMFSKHWQTEIITLNRYNARFNSVESNADREVNMVSSAEIRAILNDNKFSFFSSAYDQAVPFQIAVPPNTSVRVLAPVDSFKAGENFGQIEFAVDKSPILGPLYTIRITTRPMATGQGTYGYRKFAGLSLSQERALFTYVYEVKVDTETSRFRSGSPMLAAYKQWKERMVDALRDQLDEDRIYERNRRDGCIL
jgi:hypothetical protein